MSEPSDITKKRCLHVGSGPTGREATHHSFQGDNWDHVRLDLDPSVQPDVISDIRTLAGIENESFDGIFSSHNLEHLHYNDVFLALKSFMRVLKDRGRLVLMVPDFQAACTAVSIGAGLKPLYTSPAGPITPLDMIFGYRPYTYDNPFMRHQTGFTETWMHNVLIDQGFSQVEVTSTDDFNIWAFARKIA